MQLPLQISSRDFDVTPAIEQAVRSKADKLDQFYDHIMGCRVLLETPHRHHHKGSAYNVRILLTVPGDELIVKREPHEDLYVAIRDAFDAAQRQLKEYSRRRRGDIKHHMEAGSGAIAAFGNEEDVEYMGSTEESEELLTYYETVIPAHAPM